MMLKFTKKAKFNFVYFILFFVFGIACGHKNKKRFSYNKLGYYFQLISFNSNSSVYHSKNIAWVDVSFKTQSDSVFWDSRNNFNDNFFVEIDSSSKTNFLKNYVSKLTLLDSACLLIKTKDFYAQQF